MKGSGLVKEELLRILCKMNQYRPKIIKIRVSTFWMSRKNPAFPPEAACRSKVGRSSPISTPNLKNLQKQHKNAGLSLQRPFTQKFKIPKWVCRSPLNHFEVAPLPFPSGPTPFSRYLAAPADKYSKKIGFGPLWGWLP